MPENEQDTALNPEPPQAEVRPQPEQPNPETPEQKAPKAPPTPWDYGREAGLILPDGRRKPEFRAA
ncbi:MAG TPA: hypothetical protein VKP30_34225, partial [Polyangiaceae bacterium]|nr:hypothetical protein [Polyangiaceae bacterium]